MEYLMRVLFHSILGAALLSVMVGCGSSDKDKKKPAPTVPERSAEVIFKNMTSVQVKNNLMSACSQNRMRIQPDQSEVLCVRHIMDETREQMLVNIVNDDFARNINDSVKFVITPEGRDVRVVGNSYVQFATPLGIEIDAGVKTIRINLRDDASFTMVETLLKQAGATKPL
jgi:hypothetical protein